MSRHSSSQRGFSLMELLVALVVTMIIAGGIYGLLFDSQRTFGREPAVSEQQQNARVALSLIEADAISAGAGAGPFLQAFTDGLDNTITDSAGNASPQSVINLGQRADALELRAAVDECPSVEFCSGPMGPPGDNYRAREALPACMSVPGPVLITDNSGHSYTRWACVPFVPSTSCSGGASPLNQVDFLALGSLGCTTPGVDCNNGGNPRASLAEPAWMTAINKVRYEVRMAADGVPSLWRSPTGGSALLAAGAGCQPAPAARDDWRLVARGIEDLQVRYRRGDTPPNVWLETPGAVACQEAVACAAVTPAEYLTIVREVEVRISARVVTRSRIQGETNLAGVTARRSELRTVITPRAAIMALQAANQFQ